MTRWLALPGSRPHWAKQYQDLPQIATTLRRVYGENLETFLRIWAEEGIDPDFANVRWAIEVALGRVRAYAATGQYPLNVTLNARFIHTSDCLLSPAYGPGHTCYIEILGAGNPILWQRFSAEVALDWLTLPQALPHWAKQYRHIPGILDHMRAGLGSNIARFNRVKAELGVDPEGILLNDTLRELFA